MNEHCAVSVILPTYNRLTYLRSAVESVLAQTFDDWELVIADDGSDAETRAYLGQLAEHPNTKILFLEHTGNRAAVRNAAMRASRSRYIAFMDSDDLWRPLKLAAQVALHQRDPTRRWNYTALLRIDAGGAPLPSEFPGRRTVRAGAIFPQLLTFEVAIATAAVFAERSLIEELGGFDEAQPFHEDYDLWLRMSLRSPAAAIPEQLVQIRNHAEHYSADRERVYQARFRLLDKIAAQMAPGSEHQVILRGERAKNALALARLYAATGRRREALGMLWSAKGEASLRPGWWAKAAGVATRAVAPAPVTDFVRRLRRRSRSRDRGSLTSEQ